MLTKKLGKNYDYINAGMNAELSYNVLLRIESIIACKPDFLTILIGFLTILIGTNDANAEIKNVPDKKMLEKLNLPGKPNKKWYIENLEKIITELKEKTDAKIALCSIPIMGEEFSSTAFKQSIDYSKAIFENSNNGRRVFQYSFQAEY